MLTAEDNDLLCRVEGDAPMGRLMRAHWIPACLSEEVAERDGAPVRDPPSGRGPRRLSRQRRPARRAGRALPAPPRVARARPQRGMRPALPLPRLEDRRRRQHRRAPVGAAGQRARSGGTEAPDLSVPRSRRLRLGVDGRPGRAGAEFAAAGVGALARHPHQHRQDARQLQLGAGARRRDRLGAQLEPALDRHGAGARRRRRRGRAGVAAPVDRQGAAARRQRTGFGFRYVAIRHPIENAATHDYLRITLFVAPFTVLIPPNTATTCRSSTSRRTTRTRCSTSSPGARAKASTQDAWRKFCGARVGVDLDAQLPQHPHAGQRLPAGPAGDEARAATRASPASRTRTWRCGRRWARSPTARASASARATSPSSQFRRIMVDAARAVRDGGPAIGTGAARDPAREARVVRGHRPEDDRLEDARRRAREELARAPGPSRSRRD